MNKRQFLGNWCARLGLLPMLRMAERRRPALKILAYHRVMEVDVARYPFDMELIDASPQEFERQIAYLKRNYRLLTLADAMKELRAKRRVDDIIVVTFDDGFDDLYHTIFPILQRHAVPATIFLAAGLIGTEHTLWSEELVYAVKTGMGKRFRLAKFFADPVEISHDNWQAVTGHLLRELKLLTNAERIAQMDDLFQQLDVVTPVSSPLSHMLTWDMVREMSAAGLEFGAHSVSHSVLTSLTTDEMTSELHDSKRIIERELGIECQSMAYPVGGEDAFNESIIQACRDTGYTQVCSYLSGVNYVDNAHPFALRRIHVDRSVGFDWFRAEVAYPALCAADFLRE